MSNLSEILFITGLHEENAYLSKILFILLACMWLDVLFLEAFFQICSYEFRGEHLFRSLISIKLQSKFIEITLLHWCSHVNLLHICSIPFYKNTNEGLLLYFHCLFEFLLLFQFRITNEHWQRLILKDEFYFFTE